MYNAQYVLYAVHPRLELWCYSGWVTDQDLGKVSAVLCAADIFYTACIKN